MRLYASQRKGEIVPDSRLRVGCECKQEVNLHLVLDRRG